MRDLRDLVMRSVRLGIRVGEGGFGESIVFHEQYVKAEKICEKLTAFHSKRIENAKGQART